MEVSIMIRKLLVLLILALPALASAQHTLVTGNRYVWATVQDSTGLVFFAAGDVTDTTIGSGSYELSYPNHSFLSVKIGDSIFSNEHDYYYFESLNDGITSKTEDTIRTVWNRANFDIVQDVYPVEFGISGTIVLRVTFVNKTDTSLPAQAQYVLDNAVNGAGWSEVLTRYGQYGYVGGLSSSYSHWPIPPYEPNVPPFVLSFQATELTSDTVGMQYMSDETTPRPLGLILPETIDIADYGIVNPWNFQALGYANYPCDDEATKVMWPADTIAAGQSALIGATAYGMGEFQYCASQNAYLFYPQRIKYSTKGLDLTTFPVEAIIIDDYSKSDTATLSVWSGQTIVSPAPVAGNGSSQMQSCAVTVNTVDAYWRDSILAFGKSPIHLSITTNIDGVKNTLCPISIPVVSDIPPFHPVVTTVSSGSYDSSQCNARCYNVTAIDTGVGRTRISFVHASSLKNMRLSTEPFTPRSDTVHFTLCTIDSMQNGSGTVIFGDSIFSTTSNADTMSFTYCTIRDTLPPLIRYQQSQDWTDNCVCMTIYLSDDRPWDRGLDSFAITSTTGFTIDSVLPKGTNIHNLPTATIFTHLQEAGDSICITAFDLSGNKSDICATFIPIATVSSQHSDPMSLIVFPNPLSAAEIISLVGASTADVEIFDVLGREVDRFRVDGSYDWQTGGVSAGTYIIRANANGPGNSQPITKRVVKE